MGIFVFGKVDNCHTRNRAGSGLEDETGIAAISSCSRRILPMYSSIYCLSASLPRSATPNSTAALT
eukprot:12435397-Prorocentrum_lima.AAC.1